MTEIIINGSKVKVITSGVEIYLEEPYEIKKGVEARIIISKDNQQQSKQTEEEEREIIKKVTDKLKYVPTDLTMPIDCYRNVEITSKKNENAIQS